MSILIQQEKVIDVRELDRQRAELAELEVKESQVTFWQRVMRLFGRY